MSRAVCCTGGPPGHPYYGHAGDCPACTVKVSRAAKLFSKEQPPEVWESAEAFNERKGLLRAYVRNQLYREKLVDNLVQSMSEPMLRKQLEGEFPSEPLKAPGVCKYKPERWGQDQRRCRSCKLIWDIDEDRPPCPNTAAQQEADPQ